MRIGFTGTREGMSRAQEEQLRYVIAVVRTADKLMDMATTEFHQGGAPGADRAAAIVARDYGCEVHWHPSPGVLLTEVMKTDPAAVTDEWHEVFPPLTRNRNIVANAHWLVAAPRSDVEELRSGTWATIRYARKAVKPVLQLSRGSR